MDCTAIYYEIQGNNAKIQQLAKDNGWKVAQNVAAGIGGLVVPVLWFGMDFQGTADKEAAALQSRQQYLGALASEALRRTSSKRETLRARCMSASALCEVPRA
jgi:hypothetical protein